jgi:hypothetical protein
MPQRGRPPQVQVGLLLPGEKLVDNLTFRDQLRALEPEAIGGEMEGAGVYVAAQTHKVDWILIKAIYDWADGHKGRNKRQRQQQAAHNAAHVVFHVIAQGGITRGTAPQRGRDTGATAPDQRHQLRAPVGDFVGRADEIAQLVATLTQASGGVAAAISGVAGMGGIGKTELAIRVGNAVRDQFPDGQVVLTLLGTYSASERLRPAQVLAAAIRPFAPDRKLPDEETELLGLYRSVLHGKRVLIVADDAHDAAQVRPLLPPPGCALLITSRVQFALEGMQALDLGTLPPDDAVALLQTLCPRIADAAPEVARRCGYLPLALRVAAGLLARSTRPVEEYVALLTNTRTRLARLRDAYANLDVAATLHLSYDALDPTAQAVLAQLGVFVADFDRAAAQAIVTLPPADDLTDVLDALCAVYLLAYDRTQERYTLHELVRVFALGQLAEPQAVQQRYAQHYAQVARQADHLYLQGGDDLLRGLALFDQERAHTDAGWAWAQQHAGTPDGDTLLLAYARATVDCGRLRYDTRREQIPHLEAAVTAA